MVVGRWHIGIILATAHQFHDVVFIQFLSVREKADDKVHSEIARAERLAKQVFSKEEMVEILAEAMRRSVLGDKTKETV